VVGYITSGHARKWSPPISLLTRLDTDLLCWYDSRRYC